MNDILVIVPCGSAKIWDRDPYAGPTAAYHAYRGTPFKLNRAYAERFADRWVILSAKYGFIRPNFIIPEPYEVTFKKKSTNPIDLETLRQQLDELKLNTFRVAVGLGDKEYRWATELAFEDTGVITVFPFAGLQLGTSMHVIKHAIEIGDSGIPRPAPEPKPLIG
ncbi:MAG: DUF6884 domain-containing protein [Thermomicrobiaceae bacterium]